MAFLVFLLFTRYLVSGALSINMTSTYDAMHVLPFTICFAHIKSCVCTNKFDSEVDYIFRINIKVAAFSVKVLFEHLSTSYFVPSFLQLLTIKS